MRFVGYAMVFLAVLGLAAVAPAGDCYGVQQVQQQVQFAPAYSTGGCGSCAQAQVFQQGYAVERTFVQRDVLPPPVVYQPPAQRQVFEVQRQVPTYYAPPQLALKQQAFRQASPVYYTPPQQFFVPQQSGFYGQSGVGFAPRQRAQFAGGGGNGLGLGSGRFLNLVATGAGAFGGASIGGPVGAIFGAVAGQAVGEALTGNGPSGRQGGQFGQRFRGRR